MTEKAKRQKVPVETSLRFDGHLCVCSLIPSLQWQRAPDQSGGNVLVGKMGV